jgi:Surfeit locus protein 5 subunit 22 of Mediator complex
MAKRIDGDPSTGHSAMFLQARITALSTTLIRLFENILAVSLDESDVNGQTIPPTLTDTAIQQMQLEVDSTALIGAAEDIMVLTRSLKGMWLFGGLNTIKSDEERAQMEEREKKLAEDTRAVREGMEEFLKRYAHVKPTGDEATTMSVEAG